MVVSNFPVQATPFVGRNGELVEIAARLSDPACRLLTLVGPGGIGKTRLALEAAQQTNFPHGVFFVPLQPLTSAELIVTAVADVLHLTFYGDQDVRTQLLSYLQNRHLLLVLDNFEHLLDGADLLLEMLEVAPAVKLLVTSRERLRLREEWIIDVQGLPFPEQTDLVAAEDYSAVQLFAQSTRRIGSTLRAEDTPYVVHICRLVGGIPLAIELAAAWTRAISCQQISRELERSLDILETPYRNPEPRHRTMRATFEPTWNRLTDTERAVFRKLTVFRGGFTREAAEMVAGASLHNLSALVDKSLLGLGEKGRYDIHELLRQFGEEHLKASVEEMGQVRDLYCQYFVEFLALRKDALVHGDPKPAAAEIDAELENVRLAWNWIVEDAKTALIEKSLIALNGFYLIRGFYQEGIAAFGKAAERFRDERNLAFALAVSHQAWCFQFLGHYEAAIGLYQEGLAAFRRLGVATQTAYCLERLCEIAMATKDYNTARQYVEEAWKVIDDADESERWRHAFMLPLFGRIAFMSGDLAEARLHLEQALMMGRAYGVQIAVMNALENLGHIEVAAGDYRKAEETYEACLKHSLDIDNEVGSITAFAGLSEVALRKKAYPDARHYIQKGLHLAEKRMLVNAATMQIYVNTAEFFLEQGQYEWGATLIALALRHPVTEEPIRERARRLFPGVKASLPAHLFAAAWKRGEESELVTLRAELLAALNQVSFTPTKQATLPVDLSKRELEILRLISDGLANQEIADKLFLSLGTVRWYTNQIYSKLGVKTRTQAARRAQELNLLS